MSDQLEYLLQFTTLALAYAGFALLRYIGVRGSILDLMEKLDRIAIGLIFARFLYSVVAGANGKPPSDDNGYD